MGLRGGPGDRCRDQAGDDGWIGESPGKWPVEEGLLKLSAGLPMT